MFSNYRDKKLKNRKFSKNYIDINYFLKQIIFIFSMNSIIEW